MSFFLFQKCDTAGAEDLDPSAVLEAAAPDICSEAAFFAPRSKPQEDANVGTAEEQAGAGKPPSLPAGAWVEAAKELVPPPPPPEVRNHEITCMLLVHPCKRWQHAGCLLTQGRAGEKLEGERTKSNVLPPPVAASSCFAHHISHHESVKKAHERK